MLNRRKQQQRLPLAFDLSSDRGQAASQAADAALPALSDNELVPPVAAVQNTPEPVLARPVKAAAKAELDKLKKEQAEAKEAMRQAAAKVKAATVKARAAKVKAKEESDS